MDKMKEQLQVAIYSRVSKDDLGQRFQDPNNQIEPLKKFAKDMNWKVKFIFVDKKSGADSNRPQFKKMLSLARQHHFDILLVWSLDRFSREPLLNTLSYVNQLKKHNIALRSFTENIDTSETGTQELIMIILMWLSAEERNKISRRTKAGIQRKKDLGTWKGGRPPKLKGGKS